MLIQKITKTKNEMGSTLTSRDHQRRIQFRILKKKKIEHENFTI